MKISRVQDLHIKNRSHPLKTTAWATWGYSFTHPFEDSAQHPPWWKFIHNELRSRKYKAANSSEISSRDPIPAPYKRCSLTFLSPMFLRTHSEPQHDFPKRLFKLLVGEQKPNSGPEISSLSPGSLCLAVTTPSLHTQWCVHDSVFLKHDSVF